mgnify:FL=1
MQHCAQAVLFEVAKANGVHHSAIRPRAFPLGLLAPRCLCALLFLASIACRLSDSGSASDWGEEGILSPARSPPRIARTVFLVASTCRGHTYMYGSH